MRPVPLVLIAQPSRSGGSLLAQLLDGHEELNSYPPELKIAGGVHWPRLDLTLSPRILFKQLKDRALGRWFLEGYWHDKPARQLGHGAAETFPFDLSPKHHQQTFLELAASRPPRTQRDVFDLYFAALFDAWPGNANRDGEKRWTVGFRARLRVELDAFFSDYPDGRHVAIIRDLKGIIASKWARAPALIERRSRAAELSVPSHGEPRLAGRIQGPLDKWRRNVEAALRVRNAYGPENVALLMYDPLIAQTAATMRQLAEWLGIRFQVSLLQPTFNRQPIKANSRWQVHEHGVRPDSLSNWRRVFSDEVGEMLDRETADLFRAAADVALNGKA